MNNIQVFVDVNEHFTPSNITKQYVLLIADFSKQTIVFTFKITYKQYKALLLVGVMDFGKFVGRNN